jgi:hypothetical protein
VTHVITQAPVIIAALLTIAKLWKQPRCPSNDGLRKCGTYTQWNFIQPQRMKFCHSGKWMELESIILSEVCQAKKDKISTYSLICRL